MRQSDIVTLIAEALEASESEVSVTKATSDGEICVRIVNVDIDDPNDDDDEDADDEDEEVDEEVGHETIDDDDDDEEEEKTEPQTEVTE